MLRESNGLGIEPQPVSRKSNALPLSHHAKYSLTFPSAVLFLFPSMKVLPHPEHQPLIFSQQHFCASAEWSAAAWTDRLSVAHRMTPCHVYLPTTAERYQPAYSALLVSA